MDRRALPALLSGLAGCALGVVCAVLDAPTLGIASGAFALAASTNALLLVRARDTAERRAARAEHELRSRREADADGSRSRSLRDRDTGLPDGRFFDLVLETRVAAARRHLWPVTMVLVEAGPPLGAPEPDNGEWIAFTTLLRDTLREADVVCRLGVHSFGLLLEDTSEAGGVWAAERLQSVLAQHPALHGWRLAAGVASYPTHGLQAAEVSAQARAALGRACAVEASHGLGQVEVARVDRV